MWPEAVEAIIADHPSVADVMVRGVDDPEWGQIVEAVVVPVNAAPTLDQLRDHVKVAASGLHGPAIARDRRGAPPDLPRQAQA